MVNVFGFGRRKGEPAPEEVATVNKKQNNDNETSRPESEPMKKQSITAPADEADEEKYRKLSRKTVNNELSINKKGEPSPEEVETVNKKPDKNNETSLPEYKPVEKQSITAPVEEADEGQKIKDIAPKQVSKWAFVGKISKEHPTLLRVLTLHTNDMVKSLDIINKNSSKYSEKYLRFLPVGTSVYISKDNELSINKKGGPAPEEAETVNKKPDNKNETSPPDYKPAEKQSITAPVEEADEGQKIKDIAPKQVSKWAFVGKISKEHPTLLRVLMLHTNDMVKSLDIINKNSSKYSEKYLRFLPDGASVYISKDNELSINKKGGAESDTDGQLN